MQQRERIQSDLRGPQSLDCVSSHYKRVSIVCVHINMEGTEIHT